MDQKFLPGPMISDVEPHLLKENEWQSVINMRMNKFGSLSNVERLHESIGGTAFKAVEEFTEDNSGSRFLLIQDGVNLYRVDQDPDDGDGYENEALGSPLTMPTGITIPSGVTCKFFFYRGAIRITGPTITATPTIAAPLWYGYIKRTILEGSYQYIDISGAWTTSDSTQAPIAGCGNAYMGPKIEITQTNLNGSLRKSFTVVSGRKVKVRLCMRRTGAGAENFVIKLGASAGGAQYETLDVPPTSIWSIVASTELTMTSNTLHVDINPSKGTTAIVAEIDCLDILQESSIAIAGWYLFPANLDNLALLNYDLSAVHYPFPAIFQGSEAAVTPSRCYLKSGSIFDDSQYSLPAKIQEISLYDYYYNIVLHYSGSSLRENFPNKRLTAFEAILGAKAFGLTLDEESIPIYIKEFLFLTTTPTAKKYTRAGSHNQFYWDSTDPRKLELTHNHGTGDILQQGDAFLIPGRKLKLTDAYGTVKETYITDFDSTLYASYVEVSDDLTSFIVGGASGYKDFEIELEYFYQYDGSEGYYFPVSVDVLSIVDEFYALTGIPPGTKSLNCGSSSMAFVGERSWLVSTEEGQADQLRYSPEYQPDSHPDILVAPNKSGDADSNKVVLNIGDRIVCLKENTITQVQYSNGGFYMDIGLEHRGLHAIRGFIVIDGVLIFMDKDDVYTFQSGSPVPLISKANLRKYYVQYLATSSFITFDRNNKEVWFVLDSTHILAWQMEYNNWFVREAVHTLLGGFTDYDGDMVMFSATFSYSKGSAGTDDESMRFYLKGRELGRSNLQKFKKILRTIIDGTQGSSATGLSIRLVADGFVDDFQNLNLTDETILDEDFESGTISWTGVDVTPALEAGKGVYGNSCLKLESTTNGGYGLRYLAALTVGAKYKISFFVLHGTVPPPADHKIIIGTASDDDAYGSYAIGAAGGWDFIECYFTALTTTLYVKIQPSAAGKGIIYVDRFQKSKFEYSPSYNEFDTPVMFHTLYPEISSIPSTSKSLTLKSLTLKQKDWNINA